LKIEKLNNAILPLKYFANIVKKRSFITTTTITSIISFIMYNYNKSTNSITTHFTAFISCIITTINNSCVFILISAI